MFFFFFQLLRDIQKRHRNWASYLDVICETVLGVRIFCNLENKRQVRDLGHPFSLHTATMNPGPPGTCVCPSSICSGSMADPASHSPRIPVLENESKHELPRRSQRGDARMESRQAPDPAPHPHLGAGSPRAVAEQGEAVHDRAPASGPEAP